MIRPNTPTFKVNWSRFHFGFGCFLLWGHREAEVYIGPVTFTVCF